MYSILDILELYIIPKKDQETQTEMGITFFLIYSVYCTFVLAVTLECVVLNLFKSVYGFSLHLLLHY